MFFKALRQRGSALLYDEDKTTMLLETVSFEETSCKSFTKLVRFCLIHYDISSEAERGGRGQLLLLLVSKGSREGKKYPAHAHKFLHKCFLYEK